MEWAVISINSSHSKVGTYNGYSKYYGIVMKTGERRIAEISNALFRLHSQKHESISPNKTLKVLEHLRYFTNCENSAVEYSPELIIKIYSP